MLSHFLYLLCSLLLQWFAPHFCWLTLKKVALSLEEPHSDCFLKQSPSPLHSARSSLVLPQFALSDFPLEVRCFQVGQTADPKRSCFHSAVILCGSTKRSVFSEGDWLSSLRFGSLFCGSLSLSRSATPSQSWIVSRRLSGWLLLWTLFLPRPSERGWVRSDRHTLWGVVWVFRFPLWVWWVRQMVRCSCPRRVSHWFWYGVFILGNFNFHCSIFHLICHKSL